METILILIGLAVTFGFMMILLLAFADKHSPRAALKTGVPDLTELQFEKACLEIIDRLKLEAERIDHLDSGCFDVLASSATPITGGSYLIHGRYAHPREIIPPEEVMELSNAIIQDRMMKGIFISNGNYAAEIGSLGELAPMELIDGVRFTELMKKYSIQV